MRAVLFDFTGTLFWIEDARTAVVAALGEQFAALAPDLTRWGAINGSGTPAELPPHLADVWEQRDLSRASHRAAYSGLARHAGLAEAQARILYDRGTTPDAWRPYPDTLAVLQRLRDKGIRTALVSNIGWDPRPVLQTYGAADLLDVLVLSDEFGAMKPDPAIFQHACDALEVEPSESLMVGDTVASDGGATAIGCQFVLVDPSPTRPPDTLLRAVGVAE